MAASCITFNSIIGGASPRLEVLLFGGRKPSEQNHDSRAANKAGII